LIAAAESPEAAADYLAYAARTMYSAGLMRGAWEIAAAGLRHAGSRRDIVWASLRDLDLLRLSAEDPASPGIRVDSVGERELRVVLRQLPLDQLRAYNIEPPFESRLEVDVALKQFRALGMTGWIKRSADSATSAGKSA